MLEPQATPADDELARDALEALGSPLVMITLGHAQPGVVFANRAAHVDAGVERGQTLTMVFRQLRMDDLTAASLQAAAHDARAGEWHWRQGEHIEHTAQLRLLPRRLSQPLVGLLSWERSPALPRTSEQLMVRFRAVFESALDPMLLADDAGRYVDVNPAACAAFGYSALQFRSLHITDLLATRHRDRWGAAWVEFLTRGRNEGRSLLRRYDGSERVFDYRAVANIRPGLHLSTLRDVTDLAHATTSLIEREEQFRSLADHVPDPTFVLGLDGAEAGRILYLNRVAELTYGYRSDELLGRSLIDVIDCSDTAALAMARLELLRSGELVTFEGRHRRKDGSELAIEARARKITWEGRPAILAIDRDITAQQLAAAAAATQSTMQRQLELQLRESQKLEAVGLLAGGVAHDFNNILTAVLGFAGMLRDSAGVSTGHRELVDQILLAAERGAALTRQLLALGRKQVVQAEVFDPATNALELEPMLRRLLEANVRLVVDAPASGCILADRSQFEQVLLNLVVNARDAMPDGGELRIQVAARPRADGTPTVCVSVGDTGVGMTATVKARLFEPFFTTKEKGKGTGLGLATVYGIVTQSGGTIHVASEVGAGSTFELQWPRTALAAAPATTSPTKPTPTRRCGRILLVEDDDQNRQLAARILSQRGHEVLLAANGEDALTIAATEPAIDLLLTDVVMPGIGGRALAQQLIAARPGLRVLFVSGYLADEALHLGLDAGHVELLQKPYSTSELATAVDRTMNS